MIGVFFFSSRRRHTRWPRDWSSDVCSSDLRRDVARRAVDRLEDTAYAERHLHLAGRVRSRSEARGGGDSSLRLALVDEEYDIDVLVFRRAGEEKRISQASRNSDRHQEATPLHASRTQVLKAQSDIF